MADRIKTRRPKPAPTRLLVRGEVTVNAYAVVERAVEEGVRWGWQNAHKHTDTPTKETVIDQIGQDVMRELVEVLRFWGDADEP